MEQQNNGWGSPHERFAPYVERVRRECVASLQPKTAEEMRVFVTGCVLNRFTELDKSLFAARQYFLTLWPAFVGAIVAVAPDPSMMVYDNVWWSGLFAITSGGFPGIDSAAPAHHVEAHSESEGRSMCETWLFDASRPRSMSKQESMGLQTPRMGYVWLEWSSLFASFALWFTFCVYFGMITRNCLVVVFEFSPVAAALWYYLSAFPAVVGLIFELIRNRADLYEPIASSEEKLRSPGGTDEGEQKQSHAEPVRFRHVKVKLALSLWLRILRHQWQRSPYRVLVRNRRARTHEWFFLLGRCIAGASRIVIFTVGSITMGEIILMPMPHDINLFILLLFVTGIPRQIWPAFWENGNRGADLVVWIKTAKMTGPDVSN